MNAHADSPAAKQCPICGKAADQVFRPFCSKRCADVDLHRWFSGTYAVPAATDDEDEDGAPRRAPEAG
jgi:endogenous inhibitor of DNA gyrase (YacG/DUF329 family)